MEGGLIPSFFVSRQSEIFADEYFYYWWYECYILWSYSDFDAIAKKRQL